MPFEAFRAQWYPGHMAKARRRLVEIAKGIDFVVEVLDARAPLATHNPDFEALVGARPRFVVLAKADLAEAAATRRWAAHFRDKAAGVYAYASSDAKALRRLRGGLLDFLARRSKGRAPRTALPGVRMPSLRPVAPRGLVVGMPNTGKSTLIRSIGGGRVATGARAGVTRGVQWVSVGDQLELCDTPGILWPKAERGLTALKLVWIGCFGEAAFDPLEAAKALVIWADGREWNAFFERYAIQKEEAGKPEEVLERIARHRGHLRSNGEPDMLLAAHTVLNEFQRGLIGEVTLDRIEELHE